MISIRKKRRCLLLFSVLAAIILTVSLPKFLFADPDHETGQLIIDKNTKTLYIKNYDLVFTGVDRDDCTYFLLPSFVDLTRIDQSESSYRIYDGDGKLLKKPSGTVQDILVDTGDGSELIPWHISFLRSENLCSVFLDPGETDIANLSKENYEPVSIKIISPEGSLTLPDNDILIKLRGNTSAAFDKKPYEMKFDEKISLCNMHSSKKWVLLPNASEETKLHNKLAFDTSSKIGMNYSIESDWVDLYAGSLYAGNYLLCKEPDIGKNDLNIADLEKINDPYWDPEKKFETDDLKGFLYEEEPADPASGGYLFEKLNTRFYDTKKCGFKIDDRCFAVKSPNNASFEQMRYISDHVKKIDDILQNHPEEQLNAADEYSFSRRFLIEELFLNFDGLKNSYYFYKEPGSEKLYAGPVWDYDNTVGESQGSFLDPEKSLFDLNLSVPGSCHWDYYLYQNREYYSYLREVFRENLPVFIALVEKDIDAYHKKTEASVAMDDIAWKRDWHSGPYLKKENNVRFTKYFLAKRIEWMCRRWDIESDFSYDPSNGETHEVRFVYPDGTKTVIKVKDGSLLSQKDLPEYDEGDGGYDGWFYNGQAANPFSPFIPVFEDMRLELCRIPD